jgi:hypothetical protein
MQSLASSIRNPGALTGIFDRIRLLSIHYSALEVSKKLSFRDHETVFKHLDTMDLIRAYVVFQICGIATFVRNAHHLLALGNRINPNWTLHLVRHTFFKHFVGGMFKSRFRCSSLEQSLLSFTWLMQSCMHGIQWIDYTWLDATLLSQNACFSHSKSSLSIIDHKGRRQMKFGRR